MAWKPTPPALITTQEAVEIALKAVGVEDIRRAVPVYVGFLDGAKKKSWGYCSFLQECAIAAVYQAGRIQGIREERRAASER